MTNEVKRKRGRPPKLFREKCSVEQCERLVAAKGKCHAHYLRDRRNSPRPNKPVREQVGLVDLKVHPRVTEECAAQLYSAAASSNRSVYEVVQTVLEEWAEKDAAKERRN